MIGIILFIGACLVWQEIKNTARGKKRNEPTVRVGEMHMIAQCGCEIEPRQPYQKQGRVIKPCAAHKLLAEQSEK